MGFKTALIAAIAVIFALSNWGTIFSTKFHTLQNQDVLVVTAHPDDETMFFGPTLGYLAAGRRHNRLHFLVLSNGNSEGLGELRAQEMEQAMAYYGVPSSRVNVINSPTLQDGMDNEWDINEISAIVEREVEVTNAQTLITFDSDGVSGHPNHKAVYKGCLDASLLFAADNGKFNMLTLYSVPIWRKYTFCLDAILSKFVKFGDVKYSIVSNAREYHAAKTALSKGHKSQMVWFRQLWMLFSRYMIVNDLSEVNFVKVAADRGDKQLAEVVKVKKDAFSIKNIRTSAIPPKGTRSQPARKVQSAKPVSQASQASQASLASSSSITSIEPTQAAASEEPTQHKPVTRHAKKVHEEL